VSVPAAVAPRELCGGGSDGCVLRRLTFSRAVVFELMLPVPVLVILITLIDEFVVFWNVLLSYRIIHDLCLLSKTAELTGTKRPYNSTV
jgi:hypothetical protein